MLILFPIPGIDVLGLLVGSESVLGVPSPLQILSLNQAGRPS